MKAKLILASLFAASISASAVTIDFDDLTVPAVGYYAGQDSAGGFAEGNVYFLNSYTDWGGGSYSWEGYAYTNAGYKGASSSADTVFNNQYNIISSSAASGSNYAVAYMGAAYSGHPQYNPMLTLSADTSTPLSFQVTNTTYAWSAMTYGDGYGFSSPFTTGDYFILSIEGFNYGGNSVGVINFYLADFTNGNAYIVDDWTTVDLSGLGTDVAYMELSFNSSDAGIPTYVAIDNFVAVPEPSTYAAFAGLAVLGLAVYRKRRQA